MILEAKVERFAQVLPELCDLFIADWNETCPAEIKAKKDFAPDWQRYLQMDFAGTLLCVVLREANWPVGYLIGHLTDDINSKGCLTYWAMVLYIAPEVRGRLGSRRMVGLVERVCKEAGVKQVLIGAPYGNAEVERLYKILGYAPREVMFTKWIGA